MARFTILELELLAIYGQIVKERTLRRVASAGEDRQDERFGRQETDQDLVEALDGDAGLCRPHIFGAQRKDLQFRFCHREHGRAQAR